MKNLNLNETYNRNNYSSGGGPWSRGNSRLSRLGQAKINSVFSLDWGGKGVQLVLRDIWTTRGYNDDFAGLVAGFFALPPRGCITECDLECLLS